jgi:hypothetical protein
MKESVAMTEDEWNAGNEVEKMLAFLEGKANPRKLRLFAVACCRRAWDLFLDDDLSRRAVEVAERYADGLATDEEVIDVADQMHYGAPGHLQAACHAINSNFDYGYSDVGLAVKFPYGIQSAVSCAMEANGGYGYSPARSLDEIIAEEACQCRLLRDLFGNPFHARLASESSWLTWNHGIIKRLAEATYEERELPSGHLDNVRLAVLADALEEAGAEAGLLGHLRSPGPHYRGCFALDAVLGR